MPDALIGALLAPTCAACEAPLDRPLGGTVCEACWGSVLVDSPPVCERCGVPLASWRTADIEANRCPGCRHRPRRIARTRSVGPYEGTLRLIVHALKYRGHPSISRPLGRLMGACGADVLDGASCVVPVPLHPSRRRTRGFNQADLLARTLGLPVRRPLVRRRATPPQASLPAARRLANVREAFALKRAPWPWRRHDLDGRIVVLVDDVVTTGATLESCAEVLLSAGAAEVRALTAARAVRGAG